MSSTLRREPEYFACGDSLILERFLPSYPVSDGWVLKGYVTDPVSGTEVANFTSVAGTDNPDAFFVSVANFCQNVAPGTYILSEEISNSGTGEKHQVYYFTLILTPDFPDNKAGATAPIKTTAQINLETIDATLVKLYSSMHAMTEVQRNRFEKYDLPKIRQERAYWAEVRLNEVQQEESRNGRRPSNIPRVQFSIGC